MQYKTLVIDGQGGLDAFLDMLDAVDPIVATIDGHPIHQSDVDGAFGYSN